jgi:hypothetical protein
MPTADATRSRISRGLLALICLLAFELVAANAQSPAITLTPAAVVAGSPELIRIEASGATSIDGEWLGRKLQFFRNHGGHGWFALAGVDVEAPEGPSTLTITLHRAKGGLRDLSQTVEIHPMHFETTSLSVEPKFVEPDPEALKQIEAERKLKDQIFTEGADKPLWKASFRAPVAGPRSEPFGTRRTFNGKLASIHKGMDFRVRPGTPIRASNSGVVVLARPLYYEGNCVVIDHGLGFFTISMHLSKIAVKEGQRVARGQRLGLSGATGRVTGPHLHWAVRWQGAYLDPAKLLRLNLKSIR